MHSGIIVDINPVLLASGSIVIRWYGVMIAAAIMAGSVLGLREAERRGISGDDVLFVLVWAVPAAFVGARLFHVLDALDYYLTYPLQILAVQEGGLAIYGGLVGGIAAGALAARRKGILSWRLMDVAAPSLILGQAIGRVGCLINGDHQGPPAELPWATSYIHPMALAPDSQFRHPAQGYELLYDLAIFWLLIVLRSRIKRDGVLFGLYAALYALGRFWISAFREDAVFLIGLKEAQIISLVVFVVAVPVMLYLWRRPVMTGV